MTPDKSSRPSQRQLLSGYLRAALLVFSAWILTYALRSVLGSTPSSLFFCAVILTAWRYGLGPAVLASALSSLTIIFLLKPPAFPPMAWWEELPRFGVFLFASVFISWLMTRQTRIEAELQRARDDLERTVLERTQQLSTANARDRAITQLSEREAKLKEALRIGRIGYWERDFIADRIRWSEETSRITGMPSPDDGVPEAQLQDLIHPEDRAIREQALEQTLREGRFHDAEYRIVKPDGEIRFVHVIDEIVRDESGRPIRSFGTVQDITEHRRAEEALRRSERELRLVIDTIPVMAWTLRPDGVIDFLNRRWVEYSGISLEQFVADPSGPIHPEDAPRVFENWRSRMAIEKGYDDEMRLRGADGTYRCFLVRTAPLRDEHGKIVKWFGVSTDIEDRKRAEQSLFETKARLELILENSPLAITGLDPEGRITSWNKAAERLFDWTAEEAKGEICKTIPPEGMREYLEWIGKVMRGETVLGLVSYRRQKNGSLLTCSVSFAPQRNEHGQPIGVTAIIEDVTERKRAEDAIRQSQQLLESVLATIPVGVIVTDQAGDVILSNATSKGIWGRVIVTGSERRERSRGFWHDTGKRVEPGEWASARALTEGQTILNEIIDIETFDGEAKTIRNSAAPIRNGSGEIVGTVIVNEDVTEVKRSEERLRQAQADLAHAARVTIMGELTASIAHEVNQPLAAVVTNANAASRWLAANPPNLDEAREAVQRIARDGERASEVIRRIRALMRKGEPSKTLVNLNELIEETVALTQPELKQKKVSARTELSLELPRVPADRVQLQQVLLNLFMNAVDSLGMVSDGPRLLRIRTERTEPHSALVVVQDTGAGIKPDEIDRLFEPFQTTKAHGLGMGLAISRSIIEAHGGQLWATPNDGHGATFQFTLPARDGGER
jgi:PAS domain S-box-containing protein